MTELYRVLVVCTGNICRSPMAEGLVAQQASVRNLDHVVVESAGTHAPEGCPASAHAVTVMSERGIDIRTHRARFLDHQAVRDADLILVMTREHLLYILACWPEETKDKVRLIREFHRAAPGVDPIPDPIGADLSQYRAVSELLADCCAGVGDFLEESAKGA